MLTCLCCPAEPEESDGDGNGAEKHSRHAKFGLWGATILLGQLLTGAFVSVRLQEMREGSFGTHIVVDGVSYPSAQGRGTQLSESASYICQASWARLKSICFAKYRWESREKHVEEAVDTASDCGQWIPLSRSLEIKIHVLTVLRRNSE